MLGGEEIALNGGTGGGWNWVLCGYQGPCSLKLSSAFLLMVGAAVPPC